MSDTYEEFIKYIFDEYIEKRLKGKVGHWHNMDDASYNIRKLTKSMRLLRFIREYMQDDEDDAEKMFTPEMLKQTFGGINDNIRYNNHLLVDTGIADIIQDYFGEIVDGMTIDHFPQADFEVLQQSGSLDSRREIIAMLHLVKSRKERWMQHGDNIRFSKSLIETAERVNKIYEKISTEPIKSNTPTIKQPPIKRAIFKGIGSIVQGTLLTITDVTLAAGLWSVPLPAETTSVGAVVSIASGIGMILTGIGELRGE